MQVEDDQDIKRWLADSWDAELNWDEANLRKLTHSVTQEEVEEVFSNPFFVAGRIIPPVDSRWPPEKRFVIFGETNEGRVLTVVWTPRGPEIRPISMRSSSDAEKRKDQNHRGNG